MTKQEFLKLLKRKLSGLPKQEADERINFYAEMIDDRIEEGRTEEEAVLDIGSIDEITAQILKDVSLSQRVKRKMKLNRKLKGWEITLIALGSPIWFSLLIALIISFFAIAGALFLSLWAVSLSLAVCGVASIIITILFVATGYVVSGGLVLSAGLVCAGLAILLFFACKNTTKWFGAFCKKYFVKRRKANE